MKTCKTLAYKPLGIYILFPLMAFLFMGALSLKAQDALLDITGTVIDKEDNSPLPGVTVMLKGTTTGTVTDIDGIYTIKAPDDGTLVFSYIGMQTQEVAINGRTSVELSMTADAIGLSEVVVTGYGTTKKENLSGAVDAIDVEQLESRPIMNLAQGLQGLAPNLNIGFNSGAPGQAANFNIRGFTSINGGEPLILVDNVPVDPIELNRIAPQDVAKITVIKDASAAAIYGARASFGVVLITTKDGTQEGAQVTYTNNLSLSRPTIISDRVTDPYIYLRIKETSSDNTPWDNQNYSDETYQWARERSDNPAGTQGVRENPNSPGLWEYMGNRDWTEYFLADNSFSQDHNLSISGRSEKANYYLAGGYNRFNGALKMADDYFDRYSVRGKINFDVNDWLTIGNNTFLSSTLRQRPSYYSMFDILNLDPVGFDLNPDGTYANTDVGFEAAQLTNGGESETRYNSFQSTFSAQLNLVRDVFKVNTEFTVRRGTTNWDWYETRYLIGYGPNDVREEGQNRAYRDVTFDRYDVFNVYGTFNQQIGADHNITVIGGFNQEFFRTERFWADRFDVISASLPTIALATGEDEVGEFIEDWAIRGVFGRINYIFKDKYIVEFNGRYDGSSRFPSANRFGFFPSASAAWRVDKEPFFNTNLVSHLKLRGSYGALGNQAVGAYGYIPSMSAAQGRYIIGGEIPQRITPPALVSSNYTWEDVSTLNFGIDLGLFEDRFFINFDIFQRNTQGMLTLGKDLPDVLGASEPQENAADLETKGWDLSLEYRNSVQVLGKPMSFNIRGILSDSRSFITRFDNPNNRLTQFYEGMELGEIWGLESNGLFQNQAEIDALDQTAIIPWGALSIVPGWPKYVDQNGDGLINKGALTVDDPGDLRVIGNFMPRLQFGLNMSFNWNGFDFSAFFQGIADRDYYPVDYLYWSFFQQPYEGGQVHALDFYRAQNDSPEQRAKHSQAYINMGLADQNLDAAFPHMQAWLADRNLGERIDQSQGLAIPQTAHLLDASYLRVKNLTIGYTLPATLTEKINIARLRIFVTGENLAEWSGVSDYYDPEAITDAVSARFNPAVGAGRFTGSGFQYPFQRRYALGVNITF
jgi:TonB-linked SusC/RagA family outer membrane protein